MHQMVLRKLHFELMLHFKLFETYIQHVTAIASDFLVLNGVVPLLGDS